MVWFKAYFDIFKTLGVT